MRGACGRAGCPSQKAHPVKNGQPMSRGQSLDPTGFRAIRTVGGWGDVWYKLTPRLTAPMGYGIDNLNPNDVGQFLGADDGPTPIAGHRRETVAEGVEVPPGPFQPQLGQ